MRHEERYDEGARFLGGSTEQADGWIEEQATRARNSAAQDADYWAAYRRATAVHDAPDADLVLWATPLTEGRVFASRDIYTGYLLSQRRIALGRALRFSEAQGVQRVANELWAAMRATGSAA